MKTKLTPEKKVKIVCKAMNQLGYRFSRHWHRIMTTPSGIIIDGDNVDFIDKIGLPKEERLMIALYLELVDQIYAKDCSHPWGGE